MPTATGPAGVIVDGVRRVPAGSQTFANASGGIAIAPPARKIRAGGAGTLIVTYASGMIDTITVAAGETVEGEFVSVGAASGATAITVFW